MANLENSKASSRGLNINMGNGPTIQPVDIGHENYIALIEPDTAFWSLVKKERLADALLSGSFLKEYHKKQNIFKEEMNMLRFGLKPLAVYFNPTEQCNLNCGYCYIPADMRRDGILMSKEKMVESLNILKSYFQDVSSADRLPQVIFHGAEPMLNREVLYDVIDQYKDCFQFAVQTNGTLLDDRAIDFFTSRDIAIGLSIDGHNSDIADRTRKTWAGEGVFNKVRDALGKLKGYKNYSVICTTSVDNMHHLPAIVDFLHEIHVPVCMLNPVRCTLPGARDVKPSDNDLAIYYLDALNRTNSLYKKTGRKIIVANFANILISILAPTARRLMCDISPCGGGRSFFAVSAKGDLFPCSEFIGIEKFKGGNLFNGSIGDALESPAFKIVTNRRVENIEPCSSCAIKHFCGSPCPAEAYEMNGGMHNPGAFCELYEEQVKYALRLIAEEKENEYLWDDWEKGTSNYLKIDSL